MPGQSVTDSMTHTPRSGDSEDSSSEEKVLQIRRKDMDVVRNAAFAIQKDIESRLLVSERPAILCLVTATHYIV